MDTRKRSIAKTITFRMLATVTTMTIVFIFTQDFVVAGIVGTIEFFSKIALYYLHERAWDRIPWGLKRLK